MNQKRNKYNEKELGKSGNGALFGPDTGKLPLPPMLMVSRIKEIFSTDGAFAALKEDGSVVTWGHSDHGEDSDSVASDLASGVVNIFIIYGNESFLLVKSLWKTPGISFLI